MSQPLLPRRRAEEFRARNREGVPEEILTEAAAIVERVRSGFALDLKDIKHLVKEPERHQSL